jgi:hypothetical protein
MKILNFKNVSLNVNTVGLSIRLYLPLISKMKLVFRKKLIFESFNYSFENDVII